MSASFNASLGKEIQTEMLNCQGLKESLMTNREGTFELFVRNGSLQKAWPVPRKNISDLNEDDDDGIKYSLYKDIVSSLVGALVVQDKPFNFGYILVTYKANEDGDELEKFQVLFQDEIHFARERKK